MIQGKQNRASTASAVALAGALFATSAPTLAGFDDNSSTSERAATVPRFARDAAEMARIFPDATIDAATGGCLVVSPSDSSASRPSTDPRFHYTLTRADYVFAPRKIGATSGWFRVATIHYQPALSDQSRLTACLIGRLWSLYKTHFGREIEFPYQADETNIYLLQEIPPEKKGEGGETGSNQIDIFGCGIAKRSSLEWVRTIAHEWGHLTLYAARGYTEPESEAAGYLGERLFIKWMHEAQAARPADAPDDGTTAADLDLYFHRQIAPLMDRFRQGGPGSPLMDGENTESMDYYIGSVLATDAALGSPTVGAALRDADSPRPREFLVALQKYLYNRSEFTIQAPAWVPLREGEYRVTTTTDASAGSSETTPTRATKKPMTSVTSTMLSVTTPAGSQFTWSQFGEEGVVHVQRVETARPSSRSSR